MSDIKYRIRRALLLAASEYNVASLEYVIKHPFIINLNADIEIIRMEWFKLIKYDYLIPIVGYNDAVKLAKEQVEAIEKQKDLLREQMKDAETLMAERMQYYFS